MTTTREIDFYCEDCEQPFVAMGTTYAGDEDGSGIEFVASDDADEVRCPNDDGDFDYGHDISINGRIV